MTLRLDRPLACLDFETTTVDVETARIVQIGIFKIYPPQKDGPYHFEYETLINPTEPIPAEATAIHGITDEMVKDKPTFAEIAPVIDSILVDCD